MMAAILICGATVLTSCSKDDDNSAKDDLNLPEKVIGKWIIDEKDGKPALTNQKLVIDFKSANKVNGLWQLSDDVLHDYFVDGNLLCTRWQNVGEGQKENREWWEIESIQNGVMKWTALRMREDGTTYTATFEMTKVQ